MPPRPKINQLSPEDRAAIDRLLIQSGFSGYEALEQTILDAHGVRIGKSSLHRYGQKLERRLAVIRASTEAATAIVEAAPDDADHRSAAAISLVQSDLFEALLAIEEAEELEPSERVKVLANAARAIADTSRASQGQKRFAADIREQQRKADAEKLSQLEAKDRKGGRRSLDPETLRRIREEVYGIVEAT